MKNRITLNVGNLIAAATVFWTGAASSAPSEKSAAAPSATQSKPIPQSVYAVPSNSKEGRDPFFPNSDRLNAKVLVKPTTSNSPTVTLKLNGLSQGLAMINGRTLATGEESEVSTPSSPTKRVRIRLIEIKEKDKAVVVEIEGGERRELTLPAGN